MSSKRVEKERREYATKLALQKSIEEKWGKRYIQKARLRLCPNCKRQSLCNLLPICLDGMDCPYFTQKEVR